MADLVTELASKAGVSADQARKGVGAVLEFLKSKLPNADFSHIQKAIPGADQMVADAQQLPASSSGLLGKIGDMAGKLFGGGGGEMMNKLANTGMSPDQVTGFLPTLFEKIKRFLPEWLVAKIESLIPGLSTATAAAPGNAPEGREEHF
jgi:Protein of unknown function VcgC/VcgE (DUF2780)